MSYFKIDVHYNYGGKSRHRAQTLLKGGEIKVNLNFCISEIKFYAHFKWLKNLILRLAAF
jgi:hypothetical protein